MKRSIPKKTALSASVAVLALALSACGGQGESDKPNQEKTPVLSVPENTDNENIKFKVDPGDNHQGKEYHIGVYGGGFDGKTSDCSQEIASTDGTFSQKQTEGSVQVKEPGQYQLVMSTNGYASACDDKAATTTVKTKPEIFLDGNLSADGETTLQENPGKPFPVAVGFKGDIPKGTTVPVSLKVHGPYSTEPELRADQCSDKKVASEQTIQWDGQKTNRSNNPYTEAQVSIDGTEGLYVVTAETEENGKVATATTECENYQSSLKVSTKPGSGDTSGASSSPMSTEGTNGLTGKNK